MGSDWQSGICILEANSHAWQQHLTKRYVTLCHLCVGQSHHDNDVSLAAALSAAAVQEEVQDLADQAALWLKQQQPADSADSVDAQLGAASVQHEGLCRLCLLPLQVMQIPDVEMQPGKHCLVSQHVMNMFFLVCGVGQSHMVSTQVWLTRGGHVRARLHTQLSSDEPAQLVMLCSHVYWC